MIEKGKYTFEVDMRANKRQIAKAVEKLFEVNVEKVNVLIAPGKLRRTFRFGRKTKTGPSKKAVVHLKEGETIEALELS